MNVKNKLLEYFPAFSHRNFRLFWSGQLVSLIGTWMQNAALSWLVYLVTHDRLKVGIMSAVQFTPVFLFTLIAGVIIERYPKRKIIILTQSIQAVAAFVLFLLVYTNQIKFGYILVVMFGIGTVQAFDNPCRQSFVVEMVEGREHLMNAIALNSAVFNGARLIGPAVAGMVMAEFGPTWCFLFNAISFIAVIIGLMMMRMNDKPTVVIEKNSESKTGERILSVIKSIWEGIIFIFNTPKLLYTFIITAIVPTFCMNFNVLVPIFTKDALSLDEKAYGMLMSAIGFGALIGALSVATRGKRERAIVYQIIGSLGLSTSLILAGFVPGFITAILVLAMCGFFMIMFNTTCNSVLQFNSPDNMRGRIMSVYSLVFGGLAPIGSMYSGTVAKYFGPQITFIVSGFIGLIAFSLLLGKRKELT